MRKVILVLATMIMTLTACGNRGTSGSDKAPTTGQVADTQELPPGQEEAPPEMVPEPDLPGKAPEMVPEPTLPIKAPATAAKAPAPRAMVVQPSRSLAGHDRFLVARPLATVQPADFELGLLFDRAMDPTITAVLNGLAQAISDKNLEAVAFSSQGLMLAKLLYTQELTSAVPITRIRFSEARAMPGSAYAVALRLFSDQGFAEGLAILGTDDDGNWLIEHLDLELDGLGIPRTRSEPWDPYGYSRNLLE